MCYAGGGVGHYGFTLSDTPANANETPQEDFAMDDDINPPRSIFAMKNAELQLRLWGMRTSEKLNAY